MKTTMRGPPAPSGLSQPARPLHCRQELGRMEQLLSHQGHPGIRVAVATLIAFSSGLLPGRSAC